MPVTNKQLEEFKKSLAESEAKHVIVEDGVKYFDIRQLMRDKGYIK